MRRVSEALDFLADGSTGVGHGKRRRFSKRTSAGNAILMAVWMRLDEVEKLATGADALDSLGRIALLADEIALLARTSALMAKPPD